MKQKTLMWALAAGALVVASAGCTFLQQLEARDHLNKGVSAFSSKRYEQAAEQFKAAIEKDPQLIDAYLYLATTYRQQFVPGAHSPENLRKGQQAIQSFMEVLEKDPTNATAMANIADLYNNMNEPDKAKEWYRKLIEVKDDDSEPLYGIATINWKLANDATGPKGEKVEGLSEEEKQRIGELVEEGIEALKQALEIRPEFTDAMQYLNLLYRERAKLAEDQEERRQWEREADRLALQALEIQRRKQEEAERARRQIWGAERRAQQE